MATLLYRIGRFAYRKAWYVVIAWLLGLAAILGGGLALGGQTAESFTIPGTESQQAIDKLENLFPSAAGAAATVVIVAPDGQNVNDDAVEQEITAVSDDIADLDQVSAVISPYSEYATNAISEDGTTALLKVQFDGPATDVTDATLDEVMTAGDTLESEGMTVSFGGEVFQSVEFGLTPTEAIGVLFAGIVLFITFGSLLAAGLPLLTALLGVGISMGGIILASAFTTVSSTAPMLAVMIGLAVGIDYALFILSRHRTQLAAGIDSEESAARSVATAGAAVVFAGLTVIIALLGLLVVGIPFLSVMGVAAAFAVFVAVAIAITLLPAILGIAKGRLIPKPGSRAARRALAAAEHDAQGEHEQKRGRQAAPDATTHDAAEPTRPAKTDTPTKTDKPTKPLKPSMGGRWVALVMKAPIVFIVAVVGLLGVASIPVASLDLNLPTAASQPEGSTARTAYDTVAEKFGAGYNGTIVVVADITQTTDIQNDLDGIRSDLEAVDGVATVGPGLPDETLDTAIFQVVPTTAPDSHDTKELVERLRDMKGEIEADYGTPVVVSGQTAVAIDVSTQLTNALVPFGILVVGLSILLLAMVFRSIAVPIKAALGFVLSVGASFGVTVAVFQWGWLADLLHVNATGPIISFLPILLMAILFGLAMDYEVFLVSGMREEYVKSRDARRAIRIGFQHGARVVTAAALIMFFVFFAFVPEGDGPIKAIALALAVGVAVDAFLVRMTLVPAIMTLLGDKAWYLPKWLDRLLPNVDVEGESLREHIEQRAWTERATGTGTGTGTGTRADAVSAEGLEVEGAGPPATFRIPLGAVAVLTGPTASRRLVGAAIAGRIAPAAGHLQVLGLSVPSESGAVAKLVTLVDLESRRPDLSTAVGDALKERLRLSRGWFRAVPRGAAEHLVDRVNRALEPIEGERPISIHRTLGELSPMAQSLVTVALGVADGARVLVIDAGDGDVPHSTTPHSTTPHSTTPEFVRAVAGIAEPDATVLFGAATLHAVHTAPDASTGDRPLVRIDLAEHTPVASRTTNRTTDLPEEGTR
ncbi:MMPL family transporter [Herbiconiux sp. CPCC 203407]|uniref:MMPL family transporter n=1 Tax=Herbiconiux oxytropis TaxID=2970915 RepID=A0AA41XE86_9MICO|nr:MMPL family transporter [Herbiconiux oxytropis]MCS5723989.1 MMPL family transporter [Herbiconiux oxytropis]MCS5726567.1 MMPL family transporter [Herbiconiux oxytropis]